MECYTCKSNSGEKRVSPGCTIYEGKHWLIEHAYPSKLKGWLVIITKRHVETLHELTKEEFIELGEICEKTTKILHEELNCEKEYSMCLAEKEHFNHIHFHIVPKPHNLPRELRGSKIFEMLKVEEKDALPHQEIKEFCEMLKSKF
jgi:diadenosine tetraphosphate (Ap4A) HIT family hydrolase